MRPLAPALAAALFLFISLPAYSAHTPAVPTKYIITIKSLQLKNNTGEWITIAEPDHEVDIASSDARISFFNKGRVPEGNYINFKVAIAKTLRVAAHDLSDKTAEGGYEIIGGAATSPADLPGIITTFEEKSKTWNQMSEGEIHAELLFGDAGKPIEIFKKRDFAEPFPVKKNSFIAVWFILNLEGTVFHAAPASLGGGFPKSDAMVALPPKKVEAMHVTVDDQSFAVDSDELEMEF